MHLKRMLAGAVLFGAVVLAQAPPVATPMATDGKPAASTPEAPVQPAPAQDAIDKRIFGVLPNYRTANLGGGYEPLTTKRKFYIGFKDTTDYPNFFVAGAFAALYQLEDSHPSFGQGLKGYGKRYGTALADQSIGNMMAESIFPSLLHEDPRYFRKGTGSASSRLAYAATRIFVTHTDSGSQRFNFSEVLGNAVAAGAGNAYYRDERHLSDNAQRLYTSLLTDSFSQVLKEFWPDIKRRISKHSGQ